MERMGGIIRYLKSSRMKDLVLADTMDDEVGRADE